MLGTKEYSVYGDGLYRGVFEGSAVESVELPSTLKRIEYSAFEECESLENIKLPQRLEYVGARCFAFSSIREIVFPASVRIVGVYAFLRCE